MADKESASVPFINIDDASFLKRRWRYDDDVGAMLCPLEESSIHGSLMVGIVGKDMTPEAHAIATIQSALREYFFYGQSTFEEWRARLDAVIESEGLRKWQTQELCTWADCVHSFRRSSAAYERVRAWYADGGAVTPPA